MTLARAGLFRTLTLFASLAACGVQAPTPEEGAVGTVAAEVINGEPDGGHPMVVAYLRSGSLCSATIVAVKGTTGYALTAAHCLGADLGEIVLGSNVSQPVAKHPVIERVAHPDYGKGKLFDVAMLKFSGASGATPTMPLLTPAMDNLAAGSSVDVVGFGKTQDGGGSTGVKHHKFMKVKAVTDLRLIYDQQAGGLCSGDSGGPTTYYPAQEYVAGVHSYVSSNNGGCLGEGTDIRVSAVLDTFIQPFIDGKPFGKQTCGHCTESTLVNGDCTNALAECYGNSSCVAYQKCANGCETTACIYNCSQKYPAGADLDAAITACVCDDACSEECGDADFCNPPKCGLTSADTDCQACWESSCCAETTACSQSLTCIKCIGSLVPGPSCDTDPTTIAYQACLETKCASPCGITPDPSTSAATSTSSGGGGGDPSSTGGAGGAASGTGGSSNEGSGGSTAPTVTESSCALASGRTSGAPKGALALGLGLAMVLVGRRRRR